MGILEFIISEIVLDICLHGFSNRDTESIKIAEYQGYIKKDKEGYVITLLGKEILLEKYKKYSTAVCSLLK